jgi:hypothetical protein
MNMIYYNLLMLRSPFMLLLSMLVDRPTTSYTVGWSPHSMANRVHRRERSTLDESIVVVV